jgi:hypothetical protein
MIRSGWSIAGRKRIKIGRRQACLGGVRMPALRTSLVAQMWLLRPGSLYRKLCCMLKDAQVDLFPWILGVVLIAVAIPAVMAVSTRTDGSPHASVTALHRASVVPPASPAPPAPPAPPAIPHFSPSASAPILPLPANQVWQCSGNGQTIFSDSPCGSNASVRQLSEVNRMNAAPVMSADASVEYPEYSPSWAYPSDLPSQDTPAAGGSAIDQIIVIDERDRREHRPHTYQHEHRPSLHN